MIDTVNLIKQISLQIFNAQMPANYLYGTVTSIAPLKIEVEQKLELTEEFLELTSLVQDIEIDVEFSWETEDETQHVHVIKDTYTQGGECDPTTHKHEIKSDDNTKRKIKLLLGLKVGEKVLLGQFQGGQKFLVLDRLR